MNNEDLPTISDTGGVDRRSLLIKAAATGALVWAAPVVTSNIAHADVLFTPKCVPPTPTGTGFNGTTPQCVNGQALDGTITNISFNVSCPCGGTALVCGYTSVAIHLTRGSGGVWSTQNGVTGYFAYSCTDRTGRRCWYKYSFTSSVTLSGTDQCSGDADAKRLLFPNFQATLLATNNPVCQATCPTFP